MKSSAIRTVVVLGAVAIAGILFVQVWLFSRNWNAAEKDFDQTVSIALLNVAKSMADYNGSILPSSGLLKRVTSNYYVVNFNNVIDANLLEFYLLEEFGNLGLNTNFEYAIYDCGSDEMVYGNFCNVLDPEFSSLGEGELPQYDEFIYYFGVKFPSQQSFLLADMQLAIIFGLFSLLALVFFAYAVVVILKQKKLSELQRDFINNMTHEFKTPISSIKISSDVLLASNAVAKDTRLQRYANIIRSQNERLDSHVEKVLSIARLDDSNFELEPEEVDIHELVKTVISNKELDLEQSGVELSLDLNADNSRVQADVMHTSNVIYNLIDNAIKYGSEDPILIVSTRNIDEHLMLSVKDNGIGISEEHQRHLFEKFYRVPTGNVHNVKGFGLGLHYVKRIIDQHEWRINVLSTPEVGTEMQIVF